MKLLRRTWPVNTSKIDYHNLFLNVADKL